MKVYTTNSTSMKKKRSSVLPLTTVIAKVQSMLAKVRGVCQSSDGMLLTLFFRSSNSSSEEAR